LKHQNVSLLSGAKQEKREGLRVNSVFLSAAFDVTLLIVSQGLACVITTA
jgi:hypothetical protein